ILSGKEHDEVTKLIEELKHNIPKYGDTIMSYAEELRQEGEQKGLQKGLQKGIQIGEQKLQKTQQEIAKNLLKSGVDASIIASATHLTLEQIKSL
ncbi:MAG: Rpn family recombination-promoting nuclease/putative transposase, partial [Burkholderiales bacterium]|nr:Rpn family recombination-promoting nuclease/putative transposase [Burkholderiales bacterium]